MEEEKENRIRYVCTLRTKVFQIDLNVVPERHLLVPNCLVETKEKWRRPISPMTNNEDVERDLAKRQKHETIRFQFAQTFAFTRGTANRNEKQHSASHSKTHPGIFSFVCFEFVPETEATSDPLAPNYLVFDIQITNSQIKKKHIEVEGRDIYLF